MIKCFYANRKKNFGDELTPIIIKWISGQDSQFVKKTVSGKLLCIGSGMNTCTRPNDIVWGYGSREMEKFGKIKYADTVTFLDVRGKWTRKNILESYPDAHVPEIYGDPAMLMPEIYQPKSKEKEYDVGLIAHYIDRKRFKCLSPRILNINVLGNVYDTIDKINKCKVIVSTSLHGTIVSEAYGIPVVWLKVSDRILGGHFKFNDYFSGTGRDEQFPVDFTNKKLIKSKHIFKIIKKTLPTPIINTEPMKKAWKEYYNDT